MAQAVAYFQTQAGNLPEGVAPVRTLPDIFTIAAAGTGSTGVDVALSELAKRGIVGFKKPAVEQKVDELSPVHQSLLRKTIPQVAQCVCCKRLTSLTDEAEWALGLTMSKESGAKYGWFNAFNQGGANNGYTSINPGDSSKDLSQDVLSMTLGEIKRRMDLPKGHPEALFATGATQFTPGTFHETQRRLGLPDDTIFSKKYKLIFGTNVVSKELAGVEAPKV